MVTHPNRSRARRTTASAVASTAPVVDLTRESSPHYWDSLLTEVNENMTIAATNGSLFTTDASPTALWQAYLDNLAYERPMHNCRTCRHFIERFGGLVVIDGNGTTRSALWSEAPIFYSGAVETMQRLTEKAKVTGPFLSAERVLGTPTTPGWTHLSATLLKENVYRETATKNAAQAMAEKREDFKTVMTALSEMQAVHIEDALRILKADAVHRAEKFTAPVEWLLDLAEYRQASGRDSFTNKVWKAVATAPVGFCHPRTSVIGPMIEGIAAGKSFAVVKAEFEKMIAPKNYMRPKAAPTAVNIARAEQLFDRLGLARSLERRFARLEDLQTIWRPTVSEPAAPSRTGTFGHLKPKQPAPVSRMRLPSQTMTWDKFRRQVMPEAEKISMTVSANGNYVALTAPTYADAQPLFKWSNGVAWYLYLEQEQRRASSWNLAAHSRVEVTAITPLPTMWDADKSMPFIGEGDVLILKDCRDTNNGGLGVFPECLREDLYEVRATIEAHSKSANLTGRLMASACGYDVRKTNGSINITLHVSVDGVWNDYTIDRWD